MDPNQDTIGSVKGLLKKSKEHEELQSEPATITVNSEPAAITVSIGNSHDNPGLADDLDDHDHHDDDHSHAPLTPPTTNLDSPVAYLSPNWKQNQDENGTTKNKPTRRKVRFSGKSGVINIEMNAPDTPPPLEKPGPGLATSPTKSLSSQSSVTSTASSQTKRRLRQGELKMKVGIALLFVFMVTSVALIFHFYHTKQHQVRMGRRLVYTETNRHVSFVNHKREEVLSGILGPDVLNDKLPVFCDEQIVSSHGLEYKDEICLVWKEAASLNINTFETDALNGTDDATVSCYNISWQSNDPSIALKDCFHLGDHLWYGAGLMKGQRWPLNKMTIEKMIFLAGSTYDEETLGPVLEPYFLNSAGVSLIVDEDVPLHISLNAVTVDENFTAVHDELLCLYADSTNTPYPSDSLPHLSYTVCVAPDIKQAHEESLKALSPSGGHMSPEPSIFKYTMWSTMPHLSGNFTQASVEDFVNEIVHEGFKRSWFIIEGPWEDVPGNFRFDPVRFPNPVAMIRNIKSHGFNVVLSTHPYVNYNSDSFQFGIQESLLVMNQPRDIPGLTRWWSQSPESTFSQSNIAGVVDITGDGQYWLQERVYNLTTEYDIDAVYWIGGQNDMLPHYPTFQANLSTPNLYLTDLGKLAPDIDKMVANQQLQSAFRSQDVPGLIRIYGSTSTWMENGLSSVIPRILTLGILGYPYIVTDVIGGNAPDEYPTQELYVRWLQLSAFLPTMHFSIPPSFYGPATVTHAKNLADLHSKLVEPVLLKAIMESDPLPLIQALWLQWPDDVEACKSDNQFMVGKGILVAPVLHPNATERDIYLPKGAWKGHLMERVVIGPRWIKSYSVSLYEVPYFLLVS